MIALLISVFLVNAQAAEETQEWDARIVSVSGSVTLLEQGGDAEGSPAAADTPLQEGDRIRTGEDGSAEISLEGSSVIKLGPDSDFKLSNAHRAQTLFDLAGGTFLAKIQKLLSSQSLQVRTPTAVAAVRGTEFGVEVPSADESHVGVFDEGKVEVKGPGGSETLIGNQETRVAKDGKPLTPYQLKRFIRHRAAVRGFKRRLAALRKGWKALPPEERRRRRKELLEQMRERRKKRLEKLHERKERREERGERHKKEVEKMEEFRRRIRQRKGP